MTSTRKRGGRLSRSGDFDRVYRQGRSQANRYLVLYTFPRSDSDPPRFGVSISRKVGGATVRNGLKRLLKESFRLHGERFATGSDYVAVVRPDLRELAQRDGQQAVSEQLLLLLAQLSERGDDR